MYTALNTPEEIRYINLTNRRDLESWHGAIQELEWVLLSPSQIKTIEICIT